MNKLKAMTKTSKTFTNLMDGSVLPNATVLDLINYYEYLVSTNPAQVMYMSNIESNFVEAEIENQLTEADYYNGDESDKFY